jgi:hypothetical protein
VDERTPHTHPGEHEHEVGTEGEIRKLAEAGAAYAGAQQGSREQPEEDESTDGDDDE